MYEPIGYQNNGPCNESSPLCKGDFRLNSVQDGRFLNADFQHPFRPPQRNTNQVIFAYKAIDTFLIKKNVYHCRDFTSAAFNRYR